MTKNTYDQNKIRTLLNRGFTLGELRDFTFYTPKFRPVYELFSDDGNKRQIIRAIIEHAERRGVFDILLTWARKENPNLYEQYGPYVTIPSKDVHFITAAMTETEAEALVSGHAFVRAAADEAQLFQRFSALLPEFALDDLTRFYAPQRDLWQPPPHEGVTIRQTILDIVERINYKSPRDMPQIRPNFISEQFFSTDLETRRLTWQSGETGCIIVIDSISLFHPWIYETLQQSEMSSRDDVALLVLSPISFDQLPINQLIEKKIMERALDRIQHELQRLREFGSGDPRMVRRWLFETLPDIVSARQLPDPDNRNALRKRLGKKPRGLAPLNW